MSTRSFPALGFELSDVAVWRGEGAGARKVVTDLTLAIRPGERLAIAGPNGAGKTSLLLALVGAVPFEGRIVVGDQALEKRTLASVRYKVGFVFADPSDQLFCTTVIDEVAFGPRQRGLPESEVAARSLRALDAVALRELGSRAPAELSLGEQRRLAVASVLACEPSAVLLDEPTAGLDPRARGRLLEVIAGMPATVVFATHDLDAALELGARTVLLDQGRLVADGSAQVLLHDERLLDEAGLALPLGVAALRRRG